MLSVPAFIRIPPARGEQVRRAALATKVPISTWIELKLNEEVVKGLIPDELPGFEVYAVDHGFGGQDVRMNLDGVALPDMDPTIAKSVADALEKVVRSRGVGENVRRLHPLSPACTLTIERRGRGIVFSRSDTGAASSMSFTMALDLIRHLKREGNGIQAREQGEREGAAA